MNISIVVASAPLVANGPFRSANFRNSLLEAEHLSALPAEEFDYKAIDSFRVDRKARVHVRGAWYSVPARYVGRRLDVRVGAETIEALDGARAVAPHVRSLKGEENLVLDHYLAWMHRLSSTG
jgi:hypothetical protein